MALLTLAGLPLFALMAGFGGVEPATLFIAVVVLLAPMFALSAATILASVLCRQTRDAVLLLYFLGLVGWFVVALVGGPLQYLDPMYALDPAWAPGPNIDWPELALRLVGRSRRMGSARLRLLGRGRLAAASRLHPRIGKSGHKADVVSRRARADRRRSGRAGASATSNG